MLWLPAVRNAGVTLVADPRLALTRYRVAQRWRYQSATPEANGLLFITGVELHPTQGIVLDGHAEYDPPFRIGESSETFGASFHVTQEAMDRSVVELVQEKGTAPRWLTLSGEFQLDEEYWKQRPHDRGQNRTVGEIVEEQTARYRHIRDTWTPYEPDRRPVEALPLRELIGREEVGRLRELFEQHPSLVHDPVPDEEGSEDLIFDEDDPLWRCSLLNYAADHGLARVVRLLLDFGADPRAVNKFGDTALHFVGRSHSRGDLSDLVRVLCAAGADPVATNSAGQTPMTCGYCSTEAAGALHECGAPLTLNHALRLYKPDEARRILRENPRAVQDTPMPDEVIGDVVHLITDEISRRHGREYRLADGEVPAPNEDSWEDRHACRTWSYRTGRNGIIDKPAVKVAEWRRHAEIEREVFEEYRDLLEALAAQGADPNGGSAVWTAAQVMCDTVLVAWLFANGATGDRLEYFFTEYAKTTRMRNLLRAHGVPDEKYPREKDRWEIDREKYEAKLRSLFDPPE